MKRAGNLYYLCGSVNFYIFFIYFIQHCFICHPSDSTVGLNPGLLPLKHWRHLEMFIVHYASVFVFCDKIYTFTTLSLEKIGNVANLCTDIYFPRIKNLFRLLTAEQLLNSRFSVPCFPTRLGKMAIRAHPLVFGFSLVPNSYIFATCFWMYRHT